mgnify:CR=1 FL=1
MTHDPILADVHTEPADRPTRSKVGARTTGKAAPSSGRAAVATPRRLPKAQIVSPRPMRWARAEPVSREHPLRAGSVPGLTAGARPLAIVPRSLDEAMQLARAVVASGLAPRGFDTAEACMVAILHGLEVGLAPLAALQRIAIIEGRPTIWGDGALALVRASGLADLIEEWFDGSGPADWSAICRVRRKGDPHPIERRFSVEDARRADLWGRTGPWQRYPLRMLQMRARAFALRDAFADVLGGLYLREELDGEPPMRAAAEYGHSPAGASHTLAESARPTSVTPDSVTRGSSSTGSAPVKSVTEEAAGTTSIPPGSEPHIVARHRSPQHPLKAPPPSWFVSPVEPDPPTTTPTELLRAPLSTERNPPLPSQGRPSPSLTGRKTLPRDVAHALRLRREGGWTVPRPRRLASTTAPPGTRPDAAPPSNARSTVQPSAASEPDNVLGLIDDALSCASDPASLAEIQGELDGRINALGTEDRATADRIIERHSRRVQALDNPALPDTPDEDERGGS